MNFCPVETENADTLAPFVEERLGFALFKRCFDLTVSLALLVFSAPLYPIVLAALKFEDGGPLFVKQERVGLRGKKIEIIKFRSMTGSDSGAAFLCSDQRVTRVGLFMRKTRIDELPQLWKVLSGDLSLIGPRPELPELVSLYVDAIPQYKLRQLIKPGLTGWAQVYQENQPHHGQDVPATVDKLGYDFFYIRNRSFLLDLHIALKTVWIVVSQKGR